MPEKSVYIKTAHAAIIEFLSSGSTKMLEKQIIPEELLLKRACFVTLKDKAGKLRGCIGTINPACDNLYLEIIRNAVSSAAKDSRFNKLTQKELDFIKISVEVLTEPEEISDINLLNPKKYGLIISDGFYKRGVLLPNIEGIDTIDKQIKIVKRKAGISQNSQKGLSFYKFETIKYE